MYGNDVMKMDPNILLSWFNMKLRDEYEGLEELCRTLDVSRTDICDKLKAAGYIYKSSINQFIRF